MLEEHVVQVQVALEASGHLIEVGWNVADLIDDTGSNLGDVHVNEEAVVSVNLEELVLGQIFGVNVVLNIAVLMGQDDIGMSEVVSWSLKIDDLQVLRHFACVIREVIVAIGGHLSVHIRLQTG